MRFLWLAALLVPLSFWDSFNFTIPVLICETPYFVHHEVVIMPSDFTKGNMVTVARAFAEKCRDLPIAILYLAPRADFVLHYVTNSPRGFGNWRHSMGLSAEEGWPPVSEIAEVNVVNGEAVLRMRKNGKVSRTVLGGRDPLKREIDGQEFEILEIYGSLMGRDVKRRYEDDGMLSISECENCVSYFDIAVRTAGPLEWGAFRKLARQLSRLKVPSDLRIHLRRDAWFAPRIQSARIYAFDQMTPPLPTRREYDDGGPLVAYVNRTRREIQYFEYVGGHERSVETEPLGPSAN